MKKVIRAVKNQVLLAEADEDLELKLTEGQLKISVEEYLQYKQNAGNLMFLRLNAGDFIINYGASGRRRIKGCPKGTADLIVIRGCYSGVRGYRSLEWVSVVFLELKSEKGKTTKAQDEFAELVRQQGASYFVIRSIEELEEALS